MNITENQYDEYIKPFYDRLYELKISSEDKVLYGDYISLLTSLEFEPDELKEAVDDMSESQRNFLCNNDMEEELNLLLNFFNDN